MKCPFCGHSQDRVLETRDLKEGEGIRRRRECLACRARFSTVESISISYPLIIKKDSRREAFSKEKILKGLQAACQKRPIPLERIEQIVQKISNWVLSRGEKEIPSQAIGHRVMAELKSLDGVAYVRFASVYRTFQDVQEFVETLEEEEALRETPSP
ncbi:MAG: transcriptional regulator NrdR [Bdellovibrio sp.]